MLYEIRILSFVKKSGSFRGESFMSTPDVSVRKKHDIVILDIKKSMVGNVSSQLGSIVEEESAAASGPTCLKFILNLEDVRVMDSTGLGVLARIYGLLLDKGGEIALLKANKNVENLLVITKLDGLFDRYQDEEEAVYSML